MAKKPVVSILIPCYNAAETIEEALDSLSKQTLTNFEIVAVDDGSNDSTLKILQERSKKDERLRILARPHTGIIETLNAGLQSCRAFYVARMDTDDISYPDRLCRQVGFLDSTPEVGIVGCLVEGFPSRNLREGFRIYMDWQNSLVSDGDIRREIFVESPLAHPSVMFRRDLVERVGGYQENGWAEDYDLWLRLYIAGAHFGKVPEKLMQWREHPERLTRTDGRYSLENFLRAKAYYLTLGPLKEKDGVIIWGAGMMGRRLSKHLLRQNVPLVAFVDIDPGKIGNTRRGKPIISPEELPSCWHQYANPVILAAVGARGAREIIRQHLNDLGLCEGQDWWSVA